MASDLSEYRASEREKERIARFFDLIPASGRAALDVGARDGHLSRLLATRYETVVALDLEAPQVDHPRIRCVKGDASALAFADREFDLVICAEVLEHIPTALLERVTGEISRVTGGVAVIGVPYKQDLRMARTTCQQCGRSNPPWGHVNAFDERRLVGLFKNLRMTRSDLVGRSEPGTNGLSAALMSFAGNPYGTYVQDEPCVHCDRPLGNPASRGPLQKVATRAAHTLNRGQQLVTRPHANWIHMRFERPA